MEAGRFRQDLYFRINVFSVTIPRCGNGPKDILPLAEISSEQFPSRLNRRVGPFTPKKPGDDCWHPTWPGNVANCRTKSNASSCSRNRRRRSGPNCCPITSPARGQNHCRGPKAT